MSQETKRFVNSTARDLSRLTNVMQTKKLAIAKISLDLSQLTNIEQRVWQSEKRHSLSLLIQCTQIT